jgi:hypothetical protein
MSLMKLLSVSRSFVNGGGLQGRYKMVQQGMLPKFDAAKPFASSVTPATGEPEPAGMSEQTFGEPRDDLFEEQPSAPAGGRGRETLAVGAAPMSSMGTGSPLAGRVTAVKRGGVPWWRRVFGRRNPFAKGDGRGRGGVRAAQGELALDRVRVLRNDLRDADFEVLYPAATPEAAGRERRWRRFPGVGKAGAAWNRLTSRWGGD